MIKLLIFDAGDLLWKVCLKDVERTMKKFFKKYNINGNIVSSRWDKMKDQVQVGKIKYEDACYLQFKGINVNKKVLNEWYNLHVKSPSVRVKLKPYVKPTLRKLKKKYKLAILSDDVRDYRHKAILCKRLGLDNAFTKIFTSHDIGYKKPHKKAFFTVLKYFKLKPDEVVFLGHSKDEIEGARKIKIRTIALFWDKGTKSDFYARNFSEIPKILEKIEK